MITGDLICDLVQDECLRLQTMCDLAADIDAAGRITVTIGYGTSGLTTPSDLGEEIREFLKTRDTLGPVIWHRSDCWTFLARRSPRIEQNLDYRRAMRRTGARLLPIGGVVALPSPHSGDSVTVIRKWIHPPLSTFRPDIATLMEALIECETVGTRR